MGEQDSVFCPGGQTLTLHRIHLNSALRREVWAVGSPPEPKPCGYRPGAAAPRSKPRWLRQGAAGAGPCGTPAGRRDQRICFSGLDFLQAWSVFCSLQIKPAFISSQAFHLCMELWSRAGLRGTSQEARCPCNISLGEQRAGMTPSVACLTLKPCSQCKRKIKQHVFENALSCFWLEGNGGFCVRTTPGFLAGGA